MRSQGAAPPDLTRIVCSTNYATQAGARQSPVGITFSGRKAATEIGVSTPVDAPWRRRVDPRTDCAPSARSTNVHASRVLSRFQSTASSTLWRCPRRDAGARSTSASVRVRCVSMPRPERLESQACIVRVLVRVVLRKRANLNGICGNICCPPERISHPRRRDAVGEQRQRHHPAGIRS